jgi:hypothetical protein
MTQPTIRIHESQRLPPGWRWGAHISGPGWSGYWAIRRHDGKAVRTVQTPCLDEMRNSATLLDELAGAPPENQEMHRVG